MRKFLYRAIIIATALLGAVGCETVVDFRGDYTESLPVLNALVVPGEPVKVTYSRSVFILSDKSPSAITTGTVEMYINDSFAERLQLVEEHYPTGELRGYCYMSTRVPMTGDKVTIRARCGEFPEWVSGTTVIPTPPALGDMELKSLESIEEGMVRVSVSVGISDPAGEQNFYLLKGSMKPTATEDNPYYGDGILFSYTDIAFRESSGEEVLEELLEMGCDYVVFADGIIDGKEDYRLMMESEYSEWRLENGPIYEVECYQIDENYFKYLRSVQVAENMAMFGEPVQIHTNVEGGIGVVAARSAVEVCSKKHFDVFE